LNSTTYQEYVEENFKFSYEIMENGDRWLLYDGYLIMYIVMKIFFTAFTLSCPIPGGIFTPTFAMGAVIGQLYVSIVLKILSFFEMQDVIQCKFKSYNIFTDRGVYSILGAAAMTGSVTRTVSVAMIVLELNGHLSHAVPLMVCVLSSYAISEYLKPQSFFEMLS
jgi:H+/Cl- antiporter ClcA